MFEASAQTWNNNGIKIIIFRNRENKMLEVWLKIIDIQKYLGVKNMSDLIIKEIESIYNRKRNDITDQEKEKYKAWADDVYVYIISDLALEITMDCTLPEAIEFRSQLAFKQHHIKLRRESSVLKSITDAFEVEDMKAQYSVFVLNKNCKIDLYFPRYRLRVDAHEKGQ